MLTATGLVFTGVALLVPPPMAVATIAAGVVASNLIAALFGICVIRRRLGHLAGRQVVRQLARSGLASIGAAVAVWLVVAHLQVHDKTSGALALAIAAPAFLVSYLFLARLVHADELWDLLAPARARLRRIPSRGLLNRQPAPEQAPQAVHSAGGRRRR